MGVTPTSTAAPAPGPRAGAAAYPEETQTVKIGKRAEALIEEAAVLGYVNGAWAAAGLNAVIPPDTVIIAGVYRSARGQHDLYPNLARIELPENHHVEQWIADQSVQHLEMIRALIDGRLGDAAAPATPE